MLELLRKVKREGVDDSQYIHTLTYNDLMDEMFCDITAQEHKRLCVIERGLEKINAQRAVAKGVMSKALTAEEHAEYLSSYDYDISHIESDNVVDGDLPTILYDYIDYVTLGDKYTRISNMFKGNMRRTLRSRNAFKKYEALAEGEYEEAVMLLTNAIETDPSKNPLPNPKLSGEILRWLDRDVSTKAGFEPDTSAESVPRIRGSKSKYCLMKGEPVVGVRLRKHWRQREALAKSALMLLYTEEALETQVERGLAQDSEKLRERIARMQEAKVLRGYK